MDSLLKELLCLNVLETLKDIVGPEYVSDADFILQSYGKGMTGGFVDKRPDLVIRPKSVEELGEIMKVANSEKMPVIPRGGGAGFYEGVLPLKSGGMVIDMTRMNEILEFHEDNLVSPRGALTQYHADGSDKSAEKTPMD